MIRRAQQRLIEWLLFRYTRAANSFYLLNRWVTIRMDLLGALFSASLAAFLTYGNHHLDASVVGYALTLGISAAQFILWLVRLGNEFEVGLGPLNV